MMLRPGMFLQDRYEILDQIGVGGMSEVYRAKCHKLNRLVAIKVLKEEFSSDANFVSKFKMEAQAAAGLSHPNIVSIYDVVDEKALHFIVMELIEGITLKSYIKKKGHLGIKETIGIAIQVAQGIAAAHDQHIVHRDIKPQNMIISRDGKVKVADFGIARAVSSQTIGAAAVGTVHYISPEQARGGYSDNRSDIYSLGITMYEMATGSVPFDGDNTVTIALAHLERAVLPPRQINAEISKSLERIILKCTQKKPERRYHDAYELVADLRHALVDPDDQSFKQVPEMDTSSPTMIIGDKEFDKIQAAQGKSELPESEGKGKEIPGKKKKQVKGKLSSKNDGDDLSPQIEKILTTVGIAAAVLIVIVVLVMIAKLGGVFNWGSKKNANSKATTELSETQESLKSTESRVPDLKGMETKEAASTLSKLSLGIKYEYAESSDEEEGHVLSQSVEAGKIVPKQSYVTVTIGQGSGKINLTKLGLESMNQEDAKRTLEAKKLTVDLQEESSDTIEKGFVVRYTPERANPGDTVSLYISSGPTLPMVLVPDLSGLTESEAKTKLEELRLTLGEKEEEKSDTVPRGKIISQAVEADSEAAEGTAIPYKVSIGKGTKYMAIVNDDYSLRDMFGPSSGTTQIKVQIIMKQQVNGREVIKTILEPRIMGGDITIPVHYKIEGADGVLTGELQILDLTNSRVLKTYPLEFLEVDE